MPHTQMSSGIRSSRRGKKADTFKPSNKQLEKARHRMLCTLHKHDGTTPVMSYGDAVDFFCKEVSNRGHELGTYAGKQFKKTIQTAFNQLLAAGDMKLDFEHGVLVQVAKAKTKRRQHNQKYPKRRPAFAAA